MCSDLPKNWEQTGAAIAVSRLRHYCSISPPSTLARRVTNLAILINLLIKLKGKRRFDPNGFVPNGFAPGIWGLRLRDKFKLTFIFEKHSCVGERIHNFVIESREFLRPIAQEWEVVVQPTIPQVWPSATVVTPPVHGFIVISMLWYTCHTQVWTMGSVFAWLVETTTPVVFFLFHTITRYKI